MAKFLLILLTLAVCCRAQRPYYLSRPVGYPKIIATPPPTPPQQQNIYDRLGNRFNDEIEEPTRKPKIPVQFQSDPESYLYFLGKPINERPYHVLNAAQIDDWNTKPHTYAFTPNHYALNQANIGLIQ